MVNIFHIYDRVLRWIMKAVGVRPELVEIEPGTTMNFWVPTAGNTKPPVVLLHGFAANAIITWQFQVLNLAKNYAVYIPEFLFFGDSVTERADRSVEFQAECVAEGLRKLGVEKQFVLVGYSYGVMVGFRLAEMYPDLVAAMVVTSAPPVLTESISRGSLENIGYKSWMEYLIPETAKDVRKMLEIASYKLPPIPDWIFKHYLEIMIDVDWCTRSTMKCGVRMATKRGPRCTLHLHPRENFSSSSSPRSRFQEIRVMLGESQFPDRAMVIHKKERAELLHALVAADDFTISQYPQKMHIIWGGNDNIFDVQLGYNMKEEFGGKTRLDCIEKAGHTVPTERPFIYNKCLQTFLHSLLELEEDNPQTHQI